MGKPGLRNTGAARLQHAQPKPAQRTNNIADRLQHQQSGVPGLHHPLSELHAVEEILHTIEPGMVLRIMFAVFKTGIQFA